MQVNWLIFYQVIVTTFFIWGGGGLRFFIEISQTCFVMVIFGTGDVNDLAIHSIVKVRS